MKKLLLIGLGVLTLGIVSACCKCEVEPIVEQNQKLIVPPHFGQMPK